MSNIASRIYTSAHAQLAANGFGNSDVLAQAMVYQSMLETASFTSAVFLQNNNGFGYKRVVGAKWQKGAGRVSTEGDRYALYSSVEDSAREVADWLGRRKAHYSAIQDLDQYAAALKADGYYGVSAAQYAAGLKRFATKPILLAPAFPIGIVAALISSLLLYMYV